MESLVVVPSPSAVEECFTKNDIVFANRPHSMTGDRFTYNYTVFVWAPYGHLWRCLRRLTVVELFSSNSLQKSSVIREEEIRLLLRQLVSASKSGSQKVNLRYWVSIFSFNVMMRVVAGKWCVREEDAGLEMEMGKQTLENLRGLFFIIRPMNICDCFPILRWLGYKGIEKRMITLQGKRDEFLQGF
ncbi:unnamed protein product [Ilex paraguariensis]|uniref:Cytochrome P450 n=1 Tax=Ilex paraguariensis TaxID=185542 RepID=A0ABC8R405_9AQUA